MWPFEKKYSLAGSGVLNGWTDWHSHILPGVDDGIRTLEESLQVLDYYERAGVAEVWLTPHIMEDVPNTPAKLREGFEALRQAYRGPLKLHLGSENMLDRLFEERLAENNFLPLADQCLLVETSYFNPPIGLWELLQEIREKGYWPVLAHPERYVYMGQEDYRRLIRMDVELQLNLPSLTGLYGREVRQKARWLLDKGYYGRSGSDTHRLHITRQAFDRASLPYTLIKKTAAIAERY